MHCNYRSYYVYGRCSNEFMRCEVERSGGCAKDLRFADRGLSLSVVRWSHCTCAVSRCRQFVTSGFCLSLCLPATPHFFKFPLRDLCRRLLARLTSAAKFMYFENGYDESSNRGASLRTVLY